MGRLVWPQFPGSGDAVRARDGKLLGTNLVAREGYTMLEYGLVSSAVSPDQEVLVCFRRIGDPTPFNSGSFLYVMALRFQWGEEPDKLIATTVWGPRVVEAPDGGSPKYVPQVNHTMFFDGHWYLQSWPDLVTLDAKDGRTVAWKKGPKEMRGHGVWHEYPSVHRAGSYIFTGDRNGYVGVYEAHPQWKMVALNRVEGPWHSAPFFQGNRIYIRTLHVLYCLGPKKAK